MFEQLKNELEKIAIVVKQSDDGLVSALQANPVVGALVAHLYSRNDWLFIDVSPSLPVAGDEIVFKKLRISDKHMEKAIHFVSMLNVKGEPVCYSINDKNFVLRISTPASEDTGIKSFLKEAIRAILAGVMEFFPAFYALSDDAPLPEDSEMPMRLLEACNRTVNNRISILSDLVLLEQYHESGASKEKFEEIESEVKTHIPMESEPLLRPYVKYLEESVNEYLRKFE